MLYRLRPDGARDAGFQLAESVLTDACYYCTGYSNFIWVGSRVLGAQVDGKILFIYLATDNLFHLVRLNADGSLDSGFAATALPPFDLVAEFPYLSQLGGGNAPYTAWTATPPIADAVIQADGRIVLAGRFSSFRGTAARGLVRLNAEGTVDNTFSAGQGVQWTQTAETESFMPAVEAMKEQVDGKLLIAGTFEAFDGTARPGLASLNADGSIDTSLAPLAERLRFVQGKALLARQADGSFLLSGPYGFPDENEPAFLHINSSGGVPVVGSPTVATALGEQTFSYQIVASGQPTNYGATGLPPGLALTTATGVISGTPSTANSGTYMVSLTAANGEGTSAPRALRLTIPDLPQAVSLASVKDHNSRPFSINLPLNGTPGVECRAAGQGTLLIVTFNNDVLSGVASIIAGTGTVQDSWLDHDRLLIQLVVTANAQTVTINVTDVRDVYGRTMPSTPVRVSFLLGDTNGDGVVNGGDAIQTRSRSGQATDAANFRSDVNTDGNVNGGDVILVRSRAGTSLAGAAAGAGEAKAK